MSISSEDIQAISERDDSTVICAPAENVPSIDPLYEQPNALSSNTASISNANSGIPTGNIYVDTIVWGHSSWNLNPGPITYWFGSSADANKPSGFTLDAWSPAEKQAVVDSLANYAAVCNLTFDEATTEANANLVEFQVNTNQYLGMHEVPASATGHGGNTNQIWGYYSYTSTASWNEIQKGGDGYQTVIHELGHALGLAHPHDGGDQPDKTVFPGLHNPFETGLYEQDQAIYSAMSYNPDYDEIPQNPGSYAFGEAGTLGAFDIAALQTMYGVNTTYHTGTDSYVLPTSDGVGTFWTTIWDAGGADEINGSTATANAIIDLRAAPLTGPDAGGYVSRVLGIRGGFTIANNVVIESAVGGSGNDRIIGNAAGNTLTGNDGNDLLVGADGGDSVVGGAGNDTLYGDGQPSTASGVSLGSGTLTKTGSGNSSPSTAIDLTTLFSLASDTDIGDATTIPHVSVAATGGGTADYYKVTVANPGALISLDIDNPTGGLNAQLRLYNPAGYAVAFNNDNDSFFGAGGSTTGSDPFIQYEAATAGTYIIQVTRYTSSTVSGTTIPNSMGYELQVSVGDALPIGSGGGDDTLTGGTGNDLLLAGAGTNTLTGGQDSDTFAGLGTDLDGDTVNDLGTDDKVWFTDATLGNFTYSFSNTVLTYSLNGGTTNRSLTFSNVSSGNFQATADGAGGVDVTLTSGVVLPTLSIAATSASNVEGAVGATTPFTFTVTRSGDVSASSSATYTISGTGPNPADAADFSGGVFPTGSVTFASGQNTQTITVNVSGDAAVEPNETFAVTLSTPVNATIGTSSANGTIVDDDTPVSPPSPGPGPSPTPTPVPSSGDDNLTGTAGDDTASLLEGNDTYSAGEGNDLVYGNQGNDLIYGNQGNDTLFGGQDQDTLFGGQGSDVSYGNLGNDVIYGNLGNDTLFGGQGNDILFGGQGNDVLSGNLGNDTLTGGLGADRYAFGANSGADLIFGFNQAEGDKLDFGGQTYTLDTTSTGSVRFLLSGGGTVELFGVSPGSVSPSFFA